MKIALEEKARAFLREKDQSEVTIDLAEIESSCCVGRLPEVLIRRDPPRNPRNYRSFTVDGVRVHLSNLLRTKETLTLSLSGLGPFRKLEVSGLNLIL